MTKILSSALEKQAQDFESVTAHSIMWPSNLTSWISPGRQRVPIRAMLFQLGLGLFLAKVPLQENDMDKWVKRHDIRDSCANRDLSLLDRWTMFQTEGVLDYSWKKRGGLCVRIIEDYVKMSTMLSSTQPWLMFTFTEIETPYHVIFWVYEQLFFPSTKTKLHNNNSVNWNRILFNKEDMY